MGFRGLTNRGGRKDRGIVYENVQAGEGLLDPVEQPIDVGDARQLRLHAYGLAAGADDFSDEGFGFGARVTVMHGDPRVFGGEAQCNGAADAASGAGDQSGLSL